MALVILGKKKDCAWQKYTNCQKPFEDILQVGLLWPAAPQSIFRTFEPGDLQSTLKKKAPDNTTCLKDILQKFETTSLLAYKESDIKISDGPSNLIYYFFNDGSFNSYDGRPKETRNSPEAGQQGTAPSLGITPAGVVAAKSWVQLPQVPKGPSHALTATPASSLKRKYSQTVEDSFEPFRHGWTIQEQIDMGISSFQSQLVSKSASIGHPISTSSAPPDETVASRCRVDDLPNPPSFQPPGVRTATNSSMQAPFPNDASVYSFWNQLSEAIGICMSYTALDSIFLKDPPPNLKATLNSFDANQLAKYQQFLKNVTFETLRRSLQKVTDLRTLGNEFKWLFFVTVDQDSIRLFEAWSKSEICRNAEVKMNWPWSGGFAAITLGTWDQMQSVQQIQGNLHDLVEPYLCQYMEQHISEIDSKGNMVAGSNGEVAAVQVATSHPPVHHGQPLPNSHGALSADLDRRSTESLFHAGVSPVHHGQPLPNSHGALPDYLNSLNTDDLLHPGVSPVQNVQPLLNSDGALPDYLNSLNTDDLLHADGAVTECQERSRRLAEGDDGLVVLLDGRVVQGAFNWRTKCGSRGEKLRCFDYFLSMVKVTPEELPTAPMVANAANARESFVGHRHSSSPRGEVAAEVLIAGAFLTVGLLARLLWQRLKKPRDANSDAPRTCRTQQKTKVGFTKQHETGKDLDGECTIIPKPRFHTRLGRKLLAWFT
eukprot:GHVT01060030.1.p1 GENE.GHVT01060030.1~~GHVT01060030.1.p1  ORF type:complete len:713 (+),score=67.46 GHVT01060030.1:374-2512(+)